jgi:oligopeptidase B
VPFPPLAPKIPHLRSIHGETVTDDWFYLRDREHPATIPYLEAENRYTEEVVGASKPLEEVLYREMVCRIQETDRSCPWHLGRYEYYSRTEEGKQYPVLCRRIPLGTEEILLDCNALADGHQYFSLAFDHVSPDGKLLAWAINTDGAEVYTLRFKNLVSGELLPDEAHGVYYSATWDATGKAFFYTTLDETKRPYRLWRHEVGSAKTDVLVFEEPDARFNVSIIRSRSGGFLFLTVGSHTTTEVRFLDAAQSDSEFRIFLPRQQDVEYFLEHQGPWFYMRTNRAGKNFRLLRAPVDNPSAEQWTEVVPHRDDVALERVEAFRNHLVTIERANGLKRLLVQDTRTGAEHFVGFEEQTYTLFADRNAEYDTTKFRFVYTSLVTSRSVFDYDMDSRDRDLKKQYAVLGGYDSSNYLSERIFATAADGVKVPISLVYRRGVQRNGASPLYLYGYGSYGIITEPAFSSERVSLLDRGFVFAIAHIRGSGDMGRRWYDDGKVLKKKNTFNDFIACAEHLIAQKYTSADRLAIAGGSAGGLLMGAVTNLRPELFRVVVAHVPFVDVVNTMLDATLPLTVTEYEEWGNPNEREFYEYIRSYAPYENVGRNPYPRILVTAGLNDPRVPYWEPAKWVAKLRDLKTDKNLIVLKTNMGAGHGGPSGRYQKLREKAFEYAFVVRMITE